MHSCSFNVFNYFYCHQYILDTFTIFTIDNRCIFMSYRVIFKRLHLVQCQNEKGPTSQPEDLLDERFHWTAALVGSLAFFYFGTEHGEAS